jgi:FMN-dependent oxidoreductase (nitrilotriacetate monooxygenase family)
MSGAGDHAAAWRHPDVPRRASIDFDHYLNLTRMAERAKFDFVFLADASSVRFQGKEALEGSTTGTFEPLTLLSALAPLTRHIGLVATVSTTYNEPYNVARKFSSLDHISNGRAGWNVVTSNGDVDATNFGDGAAMRHADRYERATEFLDVVTGLWDGWDADAIIADKAGGRNIDASRIRRLDHQGPVFHVRGPLNIPRAPQGHPVVIQAGSSDDGIALAARTAEIVFTAQQEIEAARAFYARLKSAAATHGRSPEHIAVMPGVMPIIGATMAEAQARYEALAALVLPSFGLAKLDMAIGAQGTLEGCDLDAPLPPLPATNGGKSRQQMLVKLAEKNGWTVRQLYQRVAAGHGHRVLVGTPQTIADDLELWFQSGAADGFNIMGAYFPGSLVQFADHVVPELQRRGLFRTEYKGALLRSHLGFPIPTRPQAA